MPRRPAKFTPLGVPQLNYHLYRAQVVLQWCYKFPKNGGHPMIIPRQTDLGRRVVYRPPGAGRRYGVISAIYTRRLFIRFDHQHCSREVDPAYLAFVKQPAEPCRVPMRRGAGSDLQLLTALPIPGEPSHKSIRACPELRSGAGCGSRRAP